MSGGTAWSERILSHAGEAVSLFPPKQFGSARAAMETT